MIGHVQIGRSTAEAVRYLEKVGMCMMGHQEKIRAGRVRRYDTVLWSGQAPGFLSLHAQPALDKAYHAGMDATGKLSRPIKDLSRGRIWEAVAAAGT